MENDDGDDATAWLCIKSEPAKCHAVIGKSIFSANKDCTKERTLSYHFNFNIKGVDKLFRPSIL